MSIWTDLLGLSFSVDYVDAGGVRTRTLRAGTSGDPIIFMHGMSGHLEAFSSVVRDLSRDFQLHLIDSIGHGYSDQAGKPITMDVFVKHALDYMDALGIHSAHLVGLSQGGWVCAWLAAHHPERVKSTILIDPAGAPHLAQLLDGEFGAHVLKTTREGVLSTDIEKTRKRLELVIADPTMITDELVDIRYAIYQRPAFQAGLEDLMAMMHPEVFKDWALTPERLGKIPGEVMVIWGSEDLQTGKEPWTFLVEGIPRNKLVLFERTNHWPQFERPETFMEIAGAFLRGGLPAIDAGAV